MVGLGQQQFDCACRQQWPQGFATLAAPLLQRFGARAVGLLPAEERGASGRCDGTDQIARVGKEAHGVRHGRRIELDVTIMQRGLGQLLGQLRSFGVALRQLVRAPEKIGEADLGVGGEDVGLQLNAQSGQKIRNHGTGRNHEPGPGQYRCREKYDVLGCAGFAAAGFAA